MSAHIDGKACRLLAVSSLRTLTLHVLGDDGERIEITTDDPEEIERIAHAAQLAKHRARRTERTERERRATR